MTVTPAGGMGGQGDQNISRLQVNRDEDTFRKPILPGEPAQQGSANAFGWGKKVILCIQNGLKISLFQQPGCGRRP